MTFESTASADPSGCPPQPALLQALKALTTLNQLIVEAGALEERIELEFFLVNRTVSFCPYHRAVLFAAPHWAMLSISGVSQPDRNSTLCTHWSNLTLAMRDPVQPQILSASSFTPEAEGAWADYSAQNGGTATLWLPLTLRGECCGALWLERWAGEAWGKEELPALTTLAQGYAGALARFRLPSRSLRARLLRKRPLLVAAAVLTVLALLPVRQRIVAPCEVVPASPTAIAAAVDGVIRKILVRPGEEVHRGQPLAAFENEICAEELKAAEQQVRISYADYQRARIEALERPEAKSELEILANRLQQDRARYEIVQSKYRRMSIAAPVDGVVIMRDPYEWEGKPVAVGERIMVLADPRRSKVRISLPVADRIDFHSASPVKILLNADTASSRAAQLDYVAQITQTNENGVPEFVAEATWNPSPPGVQIGMKGSAIIYGKRVTLASWIVRRPVAALRRLVGI